MSFCCNAFWSMLCSCRSRYCSLCFFSSSGFLPVWDLPPPPPPPPAGFTVCGPSECIYLAMNLKRRQDRRYTQPRWRNKRSRTTMLSAHTQLVVPVWTSNNPKYFSLLCSSVAPRVTRGTKTVRPEKEGWNICEVIYWSKDQLFKNMFTEQNWD